MMLTDKLKDNFFRIPSILAVIVAILKFLHISLWNNFSGFGMQDKIVWLGIVELCCYWGGAIVAGLSNHSFDLFLICMLALFTIAAYWRDCSINIKLNSDNLNQ